MKQNRTTDSISRRKVNWLGKLNIAERTCLADLASVVMVAHAGWSSFMVGPVMRRSVPSIR